MKQNIEKCISSVYDTLISNYRSTFGTAHGSASQRDWLYKEFPLLKRNNKLNRTLYDMNVMSWSQPYNTGICLTVALFVKCVLKDLYDIESEMIGLFCLSGNEYVPSEYRKKQFCHCILKVHDKYYDTFWPKGTDIENVMFYKDCFIDDINIVLSNINNSSNYSYVYHQFITKVKPIIYSENEDKLYKSLMCIDN